MTQTRGVLLIPSGGLFLALVPGDLLTHFSWLLLLLLGSPRTFLPRLWGWPELTSCRDLSLPSGLRWSV